MRWTHITTILLFALQGSRGLAHTPEEGKIWATFGPFAYQTKMHDPDKKTPAFGGGLVAEGDVDYNGGVEIAMIYIDKLYRIDRGGQSLEELIKRMYITTGYRHWFAKPFSFGGAFFSSYSMGDPKIIHDTFSSGDVETTARAITEYGFDFSLQWEMWSNETVAVVADGRYSWSLTRKAQEDADLYGVMIGLKYLVPKKR